MKKIISLTLFVLLILLGANLSSASSLNKNLSNSTISKGFYNLAQELNFQVDKEIFVNNINYFSRSFLDFSSLSTINAIVKAARNQGIFLNAFEIKNFKDLGKVNSAFMVYLDDIGYAVVKKVKVSDRYIFRCILPEGDIKNIDEDEFLSLWDNKIFSLPLVGIMAKRLNSANPYADNRFVAIYSYHIDEDFNELSRILDQLRYEAERQNRKLIYLDELGLIPEESVKNKMNLENISEKDAFLGIRESIKREDEMLARGIPIQIGNVFYDKLFAYLAEHRVTAIIEELDYNLWRDIVNFDNLKFHDKATRLFFTRNIDDYITFMRQYTRGFWEYNVNRRDSRYRRQIENVMQEYPDSLIFKLRGIGHYGMEENLSSDNFYVDTYVLAEGRFEDNLICSQLLHIYWANNVRIEKDQEDMMFLKSFPQEALRAYFSSQGSGISQATRLAVRATDGISYNDIIRLSAGLSRSILTGRFKETDDIWSFVYNWIKENIIISEDVLEDINLAIYK